MILLLLLEELMRAGGVVGMLGAGRVNGALLLQRRRRGLLLLIGLLQSGHGGQLRHVHIGGRRLGLLILLLLLLLCMMRCGQLCVRMMLARTCGWTRLLVRLMGLAKGKRAHKYTETSWAIAGHGAPPTFRDMSRNRRGALALQQVIPATLAVVTLGRKGSLQRRAALKSG